MFPSLTCLWHKSMGTTWQQWRRRWTRKIPTKNSSRVAQSECLAGSLIYLHLCRETCAGHPHALVLSFCFRACRSVSLSKSLVANGSSSTLLWGNTTLCVQCSNNLSNSRKWDLSIKLVWCLWGCLWRNHWMVAPETGVVLNEGPGLMYSRAWCSPVYLDSLDVFCTPKYSTYEERKKS